MYVGVILLLVLCIGSVRVSGGVNLTLLHVNDIHVRMEETTKFSSTCKNDDKAAGKCYGGLSRLYTAVKDIKNKDDNVIWVNAGDFYQGTVWYTQFKWRAVSVFNKLLGFDAMTLGNHEFDDRIEGLIPFLQNQTNPIVVTNMDASQVPELKDIILPSVVLQMSDVPVGLVGYLTPATSRISNPGDEIIFNDEIESLKLEVDKLQKSGVKIIIAVGHSGYQRDQEIAKAVPELDVIVGGHSHSFLYSETETKPNPSNNIIQGPYPTIVDHPETNSKTLVVQASAYTKYLGNVKLMFDNSGVLEGWEGEPILLDNSYIQDPMMEAELKPWRDELDLLSSQIVGNAKEVLDNQLDRECKIGNFITDAMVESWKDKTMPDGSFIRLAFINSGGIKSGIEKGNITMEDLLTIFPFQNTFDAVKTF